jgi:DGQHR domain-containing protein
MQINLADPPLNQGIPVFGNAVSSTEFQGVLTHGLFKMVVPDPRRLEETLAKYNTDLTPVASLRSRVQRLVTGAKKRNVEPYARYIIGMVKTGEGFTPQIVLWSEKPLRVERDENTGFAWLLIPHELKFVALDGDTQTVARNLAEGLQPGLLDKEHVKVVVKHGVSEEEAQQIFADCNSQGVKVSTSMAIGLDNRDDATQLTKFVERTVPTLTGRVNRQKRQLGGNDTDIVTISALRASIVCFAEGINGVQNQTRSVSVGHIDDVQAAAVKWYSAVTTTLANVLQPERRAETFSSAPAVWCAIGAIGHDVLVELAGEDFEKSVTPAAVEHAFRAAADAKLAGINWTRGEHWLSVGAKQSLSGAITLGGPKESGSLVYKALKDGSLLNQQPAAAE